MWFSNFNSDVTNTQILIIKALIIIELKVGETD